MLLREGGDHSVCVSRIARRTSGHSTASRIDCSNWRGRSARDLQVPEPSGRSVIAMNRAQARDAIGARRVARRRRQRDTLLYPRL